MPKPPMNDSINIYEPETDANGAVIKDRYGRPIFKAPVNSKARVRYISQAYFDQDSIEQKPIIEADLPPEARVTEDCEFEWTDRFGKVIRAPIEGITEVLNYSGKAVYYRTIYINKAPTRD